MLEFAESILRMADASFQVNCLCGSFPQQNTSRKRKAPVVRGPVPKPKPRTEYFKTDKEKLFKK